MGVREKYGSVRSHSRPRFGNDLVGQVFSGWEDLGSPDPAVMIGKAKLQMRSPRLIGRRQTQVSPLEVMVIGQVNGGGKEGNYGMMRPDGYRAALAAMREAEEQRMPLVTFIDTPGADSYEASNRGLQAWAISDCIAAMCGLAVPTVAVILGEGGSGGALALGVADRVLMAENAVYAVIAPEGCAAILLKESTDADITRAAEAMEADAGSMRSKGIVDRIIGEPRGGAHTKPFVFYRNIKTGIVDALNDLLKPLSQSSSIDDFIADLLQKRYKRYTKNDRTTEAGNYRDRIISFKEVSSEGVPEETGQSMNVVVYTGLIKIEPSHEITLSRALTNKIDGPPELFPEPIHPSGPWKGKAKVLQCSKNGTKQLEQYMLPNFIPSDYSCPNCDTLLGEKISESYRGNAQFWIDALADGEFHEFSAGLVSKDLSFSVGGRKYRDQYNSSLSGLGITESLRIGTAEVSGIEVMLAISNLSFIGGSMGVVFGKKFLQAADYATEKGIPLVSVTASGGARMQEGILSLMQMATTVMATKRLRKAAHIPHVSVLDVATGGAVASYAVQADLILGVEGGTIAFAGPRVVEVVTGRTLSPESLRPEFYYSDGVHGVHRIVKPGEVKNAVAEYLKPCIPVVQPLA